MKAFVQLFALVAALLSLSNAAPPVLTNSYSQFKTIYIENMVIRAYLITVEFDQPIFVNGVPITSKNLTVAPPSNEGNCNGGGGGGPGFPPIVGQMMGKLRITCGSQEWTANDNGNNDGPPAAIMATVTTADPGSSFMGFLSGFAMPEYINPNAISFLKLISASQGGQSQLLNATTTEDSIRTCGTKNIYIAANAITNAQRQSVATTPIPVTAAPRTPTCNYDSISSFKAAFDYVSNIAKLLAVDATLYKQFSFLQGALDSRDALSACKSLVDPMLTTDTVTKRLSPTRQCVYQDGTPEYQRSPCCNRNLQFSQCCAPVSPVTNVTVVKNVTLDRIVGHCSHPNKIILSLYSYINTANSVAVQTENQESLQERFGKFQNTCQNLIYGKKCTIDADCAYSGSCDTNQGQCKIPWGADADLQLSCFYDQFDPVLRSSLAGLWALTESDKTGFVNRMKPLLLMDDCVGNNAWNLQTRCNHDRNGCKTCTQANQTLCLADKSCNWNGQIRTGSECTAVNPVDSSTNFCGQCWGDGSSCWSQSSPDMCVRDFYNSENACRAANYTWYVGPWQSGTCVDTTKRSKADCLPTDACPTLTSDGHGCESWGSHMCYALNVTQTECNNAGGFTRQQNGVNYNLFWQPWRNNGAGVCAFSRQWSQNSDPFTPAFCSQFSPAVNNKTVKFFPGGYWTEGQFNTQQKCQAGLCNWQDPLQRQSGWGLTPQQCSQKQMCSQPCPRCRAQQWNGPGVSNFCYSMGSNITNLDDCSRKTGQWAENVVGNTGRCMFSQDAAVASPSACRAYGESIGVRTGFASCDPLSMDSCSNPNEAGVGELGSWLKCYWDMNAQCRNPTECAQSGRCNDDDKQIWRQNGPSIPGSCHVDNVLNEWGWPADCNSLKSRSRPPTNTTLTWSRYPMKCVDPTALNSTACAAVGGQWKTKAKNQAECLADIACYDEGSNWPNGKAADECGKCSGSMAPIYNWSPGQWVNASMQPLQWKAKSFSSMNQWGKRVDHEKVWETIVSPAVYYYLGSSVYSSLTAKYSLVSDLFKLFSCDCTEGRDQRNCFGEVQASPIAAAFLQKGKVNKIETPLGVIKASLRDTNTTLVGRRMLSNGQVSITVSQVTAQNLAELGLNNQPDYRVVRASPYSNVIVGQLVGDGMQVSGFTPDLSQVVLTCYLSQAITPDSVTYPVPWIGYLKPNTTRVFPLQGIQVQFGNGSITTSNITSDGTYFPIYLQSTWKIMLATTKKATTTKATVSSSKASAAPLDNNGTPSPGATSASPTTSAGSPTTAGPAPTPAPTTAGALSPRQHPLVMVILASLCAFMLF